MKPEIERAGCGLRKNTSVCDWYAIDRVDPVGGKSFSGYGGIRDAVAKLSKLADAHSAIDFATKGDHRKV